MDNVVDKKKLKLIKSQLEFYFSEGNLPRDEFMQNCINASKHKSILIEDMLKFNKLIELDASEDLITLAVNKSKLLKFDDDNKGIKRTIELEDLKPVNTRTIFISGFLNDDNINKSSDEIYEELKSKFKVFGKVLRIDLPRYTTSSGLRGFGFIEFLTKTSTRNALKEYKLANRCIRKANSWKYFSFTNSQYSHALKQLELLGHPQKLFFEKDIGEQRKEKINTQFNAIAKKEWIIFRQEFYQAQQQHLSEMKALLASYQSQQVITNSYSHKQHERDKAQQSIKETIQAVSSTSVQPELSQKLISGSIVAFECPENQTKKTIKTHLTEVSELENVAYVDFRDFSLSGFLRFKSSEAAHRFSELIHPCLVGSRVLSETEEHQYLTKISQDKESKKESQKRKNSRKRKHDQLSNGFE